MKFLSDRVLSGLIFLISLFVYSISVGPYVTYADSGDFIMTAKHLGLAHPPGYPLYTLFAHLFSYLPFGSTAYQINLVNCFLGAVLNVVFFLTLRRFNVFAWVAFIFSLVFAFSNNKWYQSVISEVYVLHTLFFLVLLNWAYSLRDNWTDKKAYGFVFVYALSLTNHWPLMGLMTPVYLFILRHQIKNFFRLYKLAIPIAILGLTPYAYLYFRSQSDPFFSFLPPMQGLGDLWDYILRKSYSDIGKKDVRSFAAPFSYLWLNIKFIPLEFSWAFAPAVLAAVIVFLRSKKFELFAVLAYCFLSSTFILFFLLKVELAGYFTDGQYEFQLIPVMAISLMMALAAQFLLEEFQEKEFRLTLAFLLVLGLFYEVSANHARNNFKENGFVNDYAVFGVNMLPEGANLVLSTDADTFTMSYVATEIMPEKKINLYLINGAAFANRFVDTKDDFEVKKQKFYQFVLEKKNIFMTFDPPYPIDGDPRFVVYDLGAMIQITAADAKIPKLDVSGALPLAQNIVKHRLATNPDDFYWQYIQSQMIESFCRYFLLNGDENNEIFQRNAVCRVLQANYLNQIKRDFKKADELFTQSIASITAKFSAGEISKMYFLWFNNFISMLNEDKTMTPEQKTAAVNERVPILMKSFELNNRCDNPMFKTVEALIAGKAANIDISRIEAFKQNCVP